MDQCDEKTNAMMEGIAQASFIKATVVRHDCTAKYHTQTSHEMDPSEDINKWTCPVIPNSTVKTLSNKDKEHKKSQDQRHSNCSASMLLEAAEVMIAAEMAESVPNENSRSGTGAGPAFTSTSTCPIHCRCHYHCRPLEAPPDFTAQSCQKAPSDHQLIPSLAPPFNAFPAPPQLCHSSAIHNHHNSSYSFQMPFPLATHHLPTVMRSTISIGFGMDTILSTSSSSSFPATEAAVRALLDALDRSVLRCSLDDSKRVYVYIKLGVPAETHSPTIPMPVELTRLTKLMPPAVVLAPITVVVGGLFVPGGPAQEMALCSVVACLTIQYIEEPTSPNQQALPSSPMDMLAQISENVRENHPLNKKDEHSLPFMNHYDHRGDDSSIETHEDDTTVHQVVPEESTGVTTKNHRRQLVQHDYTDHSSQCETTDDGALMLVGKSYNTAFPIKLHEALQCIEEYGSDRIISWQPHGRSFKIHKQKEFEQIILPKYFVMTKKSSFLRQLNLYGFHRLSAGPDKGAYYHELFLRGMPFLSRRMVRQKINGNGIRAAGNPAQEPDFYKMPTVRLTVEGVAPSTLSRLPTIVCVSKPKDTMDDASMGERSGGATSIDTISHPPGKSVSFPVKLLIMLNTLEAQGKRDVISWMPHGRGFIVHQQEAFATEIIPQFFRHSKFSSFQRQLHMYSFQRITKGSDKGGYYHPNFLRGQPESCQQMIRTRVNGNGCRKVTNPFSERKRWIMSPSPPVLPSGAVVEIPLSSVMIPLAST